MKKIVAVPVIAVVAAVGAASAAGFAGGVSAGPLQVGQTHDLTCANSAKVIEWGYNDHLSTPNVVNVRVQLNGAHCVGQSVSVIPLNSDGSQMGNSRAAGKVPAQNAGTQTVRLNFDNPVVAENLNSVRISVDPGFQGEGEGTLN